MFVLIINHFIAEIPSDPRISMSLFDHGRLTNLNEKSNFSTMGLQLHETYTRRRRRPLLSSVKISSRSRRRGISSKKHRTQPSGSSSAHLSCS